MNSNMRTQPLECVEMATSPEAIPVEKDLLVTYCFKSNEGELLCQTLLKTMILKTRTGK